MTDLVRQRLEPHAYSTIAIALLVYSFRSQLRQACVIDKVIIGSLDKTKAVGNFLDLHQVVEVLRLADSLLEDALDIFVHVRRIKIKIDCVMFVSIPFGMSCDQSRPVAFGAVCDHCRKLASR